MRSARKLVQSAVGAVALLAFALFLPAPGAAAARHARDGWAHRPNRAVAAHVVPPTKEGSRSLPAAPSSGPPHRHMAVVAPRHASGHRTGVKASGRQSPTLSSDLAGTGLVSSRSAASNDGLRFRREDCQVPSGRGPPSPRLPRATTRSFIEPRILIPHHLRLRFLSVSPDVDLDPSQERSFTRSRAAFQEGTAAYLIPTLRGGVV